MEKGEVNIKLIIISVIAFSLIVAIAVFGVLILNPESKDAVSEGAGIGGFVEGGGELLEDEICDDGVDNDGDGFIDEDDTDCESDENQDGGDGGFDEGGSEGGIDGGDSGGSSGGGDSGGVEVEDCELLDAYWEPNNSLEGEEVSLFLIGTELCDSKTVEFDIYWVNPGGSDVLVDSLEEEFEEDEVEVGWTVVESDGGGMGFVLPLLFGSSLIFLIGLSRNGKIKFGKFMIILIILGLMAVVFLVIYVPSPIMDPMLAPGDMEYYFVATLEEDEDEDIISNILTVGELIIEDQNTTESYIIDFTGWHKDNGINKTSIRWLTEGNVWEEHCVDKYPGNLCDIGSVTLNISSIIFHGQEKSVEFYAEFGMFDRLYDLDDNYVVLPNKDNLPASSLIFEIKNPEGEAIEDVEFGWGDNHIVVLSNTIHQSVDHGFLLSNETRIVQHVNVSGGDIYYYNVTRHNVNLDAELEQGEVTIPILGGDGGSFTILGEDSNDFLVVVEGNEGLFNETRGDKWLVVSWNG